MNMHIFRPNINVLSKFVVEVGLLALPKPNPKNLTFNN